MKFTCDIAIIMSNNDSSGSNDSSTSTESSQNVVVENKRKFKNAKRKVKIYQNYDPAKLELALQHVEHGKSYREAAKLTKVPKTTIERHAKHPETSIKSGRKFALTDMQEEELEIFALDCQLHGTPLTMTTMKPFIREILTLDNVKFNKDFPSDKWVKSYVKRRKNLSFRKMELIHEKGAEIDGKEITDSMYKVREVLKMHGYENLLEMPERMFNSDETHKEIAIPVESGILKKGTTNVHKQKIPRKFTQQSRQPWAVTEEFTQRKSW